MFDWWEQMWGSYLKDLEAKNLCLVEQVLVHEGDLGGKKHEREQTFRPAQSVSADTLALKTSSLVRHKAG